MVDRLRSWLLDLLRVPPEPQAPSGGRVVRVFRAGPGYFRYILARWAIVQVSALTGLIGSLVFISITGRQVEEPVLVWLLRGVEFLAWAGFLVQLPLSYAIQRLDFDLRWYILSDRSLRIREGILQLNEKTVTFANIQQISIRQNPLQRVLGISDVQVTTAGGGSGGKASGGKHRESMHEAYFRGVDNAEEIREVIRERVRQHRDSGLGDPDSPAMAITAAEHHLPDDVLDAATELRDAMRALRVTVERS